MNQKQPIPPPPPGLSIDDIYHIFFRHKGKILTIWAIGLIAVAAVWLLTPTFYRSDAKILIRFIVENTTITPGPGNAQDAANVKSVDPRGAGIINAEIQIMTSYDLALEVADIVGPEKILAKNGGGSNRNLAAGIIMKGMTVDGSGAVIFVSFRNEDPTIVQPVLTQILESYRKKNMDVYLATGSTDEFLTQQADQIHSQLAQAEQDLRQAKAKLGINSLEDSKKEQAGGIAQIQGDIFNAQAELVGHLATVHQLTNALAAASISTPAITNVVPKTVIPADISDKYRRICSQLESLRKDRLDLESKYTPESVFVKPVQEGIVKAEKEKALLEAEYPDLTLQQIAESSSRPQANGTLPGSELLTEMTRIRALEARIALQQQRLATLRSNSAALYEMEGSIVEMQRKRDELESKYRYFTGRLERDRFAEAAGPERISSISTIQSPSPAHKDMDKLSKKLFMIAGAAIAAGLALAFFIETYLDRTFKRPIEIEKRLRVPLFLSIPRTARNGMALLGGGSRKQLGSGTPQPDQIVAPSTSPSGDSEVAPWKPDHELRTFFNALRDRLIMSFELRNLTHNPKLVALTSCREGSGVSTVASGLAASLSETGEGNVLLVDMNNVGQGSAHYFRKGKLEVSLDEALEADKRENAMVQENLYVVAENGMNQNLPRVLHKRFSALLPRLKASDYD
ncbi:MAG TPA: hypothetical protein VK327_13210, partial [Candidatus Paceibacterota bacterium]|nr:hypothetical protein [Candidatus Paceibacterota bacterium]